jgi:hypothetical protein
MVAEFLSAGSRKLRSTPSSRADAGRLAAGFIRQDW